MAEFTKPKHGEICWRELQTKNLGAAVEFYKALFGWNTNQSAVTGVPYHELHFDGKAVGGMMEITKEWGEDWEKIPTSWRTYIAVDDIAATVAKIKQQGGIVCVEPFDAPNVGKMSVINDPSGITFAVIQFA